jgi:hypothetical protein
MIKAAAKMGWINEEKAILETLTSMKRAGADLRSPPILLQRCGIKLIRCRAKHGLVPAYQSSTFSRQLALTLSNVGPAPEPCGKPGRYQPAFGFSVFHI